MAAVLGAARIALGALALTAVGAQLVHGAGEPSFSVANFLSFFTIQSNLLAACVLVAAGLVAVRGRAAGPRLAVWRGAATLYMATTGLVYLVLLSGDESSLMGWVDLALHYVMPVAVVADWALDRPRAAIPFARAAVAWLAYPAAFLAYSLVRGEIAGWYPYAFLDPADGGYAKVALVAAAIGAGMLAGAWLLARGAGPGRRALARPPAASAGP